MNTVGIGTRVLNFLIDMFFISLITFAVNRGWSFYVFYYHIFDINFFYFLVIVGFVYYFFFESIWRRTPGKWLSLSKVVNKQGNKPTLFQILIRTLMRIVGAILLDSIFLSFADKTLHDVVSKTEVVEI